MSPNVYLDRQLERLDKELKALEAAVVQNRLDIRQVGSWRAWLWLLTAGIAVNTIAQFGLLLLIFMRLG